MSIIDGERSQVTSLTLRLTERPIALTRIDMISSLFVPGMAAAGSLASVAVLVGQERPYLAVAQTRLVKAHVRGADIIGVEIEPTAKLLFAPVGVTAYLIAVQVGKMFAVDAVHLRYLFNRQGCRLHLRLLKSHELGTESCSFIVGKLEIVAEDFVGLLVPPLVSCACEETQAVRASDSPVS